MADTISPLYQAGFAAGVTAGNQLAAQQASDIHDLRCMLSRFANHPMVPISNTGFENEIANLLKKTES